MTTRVPAAEWREIFAEVWRRYRDYFYVANMHGYDWKELRRKYEPLLDYVGHRADLNYVIAEMICRTDGAARLHRGRRPRAAQAALRGAAGRTVRARCQIAAATASPRSSPARTKRSATARRSPKSAWMCTSAITCSPSTGANSKAGTDPYELLQAPPNQPVEWRVAATPDGKVRAHHPLSAARDRNRPAVSRAG